MRKLATNRNWMARWALLPVVALGLALPGTALAQGGTAAENFAKLCAACHTIGGGKRVGPDLKGVSDRRSEEWLIKWIASSQALVKAGDPDAVALFHEYSDVPMPDVALSPAEIRDILVHIRGGAAQEVKVEAAPPATPEEIAKGAALFQGTAALANGGPACSSCHHVMHDEVIGGGVLAKELTTSYTRLGGPGLQAILSAPPFPVMEQAFAGKPLTEAEVRELSGYLESLSGHSLYDQPRQDSMKLLFGGLGGALVLMALYGFLWRNRKAGPVNQKVFARQLDSE